MIRAATSVYDDDVEGLRYSDSIIKQTETDTLVNVQVRDKLARQGGWTRQRRARAGS